VLAVFLLTVATVTAMECIRPNTVVTASLQREVFVSGRDVSCTVIYNTCNRLLW